ncbi:MAG: TonB-dependent receptor [Halobacteriovoraceae bacterium]|nr:TonB-dependent receptor [Halobacteriovoraceae bacterium]
MNKSFLFSLLFTFNSLGADELPIIVTPPSGVRNYAGTMHNTRMISKEEIENSGALSVVDILKRTPELFINTNGAFGKASSISLRGTSNRHTLILIDGIRVTDLTSISGGSRLELLDLSDVESIEILKGAGSVLYGSEAIGGVIKITTKGSQIKRTSAKVDFGSYDNTGAYLSHSNYKENLEYKTSLFFRNVEGISSFDGGRENDGLQNLRFNGKIGYALTKVDRIDLDISLEDSDIEFDDSSSDNSLNESNYQSFRGSFLYEHEGGNFWNPKIVATSQIIDRRVKTINSFGNSVLNYEGSFKEIEATNFSRLGSSASLITGVNYELEKAESLGNLNDTKRRRERKAAFFNYLMNFKKVNYEFGLRHDRSQFNGKNTLYRLGAATSLFGFILKASQATGFKAPSLYQSFSSFGNASLKAEKARTQDFSLIKEGEIYRFEITYFTVDINNFIDYDNGTNQYFNLGALKNKGLEFSLQSEFRDLDVMIGGTLSNPVNPVTNAYAARRPRRKLDTRVNYQLNDRFKFGLEGSYVGDRNETNGTRLPSYTIFSSSIGYEFKKWKTSLFLNNIMNKDYQEIRNFGAPGRNFLISLSREWL